MRFKQIFNTFAVKYVIAGFFVWLIILGSLFLLLRVILQRSISSLWVTGLFLSFFLLKKSINFFLYNLLIIKSYFFPVKNKESKESRLIIKLENLKEKIFDFFFFILQDIFYKSWFFQLFSIRCLKILEKFLNFSKPFVYTTLLIPWSLFYGFFFFEVFQETNLEKSLCFLSLNFLIRYLFKLAFVLTQYELSLEKKRVLGNNFPNFYGEEQIENFFSFNNSIRDHFLLKEKFLAKKQTLMKLWWIFTIILYYSKAKHLLEFMKEDYNYFCSFLSNINIILFGGSFLFIWLNTFLSLHSLFIVFVLFLMFVGCLLVFLDFLETTTPKISDTRFLLNTSELLNSFADTSFLKTKKRMLKKYTFLKETDLPYPYKLESVEFLYKIRDAVVFDDLFTTKDRAFLTELTENIYFVWFIPRVLNGKIDLVNLSLKKKKLY